MNDRIRVIKISLAFVVILVTIYAVYFTPKAKYQGKEEVIGIMDSIPEIFGRWRGRDVPVEVDEENPLYNFLSRAFARQYFDLYRRDKGVAFILLDAGNFHYPKVCLTGSGAKTTDLAPQKINVGGRDITVQLVLAEDQSSSILTVYWICIDKKLANQWINQKIKQLFYSLFNKQSVGLMVRADVSFKIDEIDEAVEYVEKFFGDIYKHLPEETRDYLFGKKE